MTNRAEEAWKEWHTENSHVNDCNDSFPEEIAKTGFLAGYTRGRAEAWELPEVRADELVRGEAYLMKPVGVREWSFYRCEKVNAFIGSKVSFRGPLPLERVE